MKDTEFRSFGEEMNERNNRKIELTREIKRVSSNIVVLKKQKNHQELYEPEIKKLEEELKELQEELEVIERIKY